MAEDELLKEKLDRIKNGHDNEKKFIEHRMSSLECCMEDHEQRMRVLQDEMMASKTKTWVISIASGLVALLALIKAFLAN